LKEERHLAPRGGPGEGSSVRQRQLTVLFCDLVGSAELTERLEPEQMHALLHDFYAASAKVIERNGGFLARLMGDGILAYFGYPRAAEIAAASSIHAGFELLQAVTALRPPSGGRLAGRIGIATDLSVLGDVIERGGAREHLVVGSAPNLAARLQQLSSPGAIVVAERTRRLASSSFAFRDLGAFSIKGFALPIRAFQPVGVRDRPRHRSAQAGKPAQADLRPGELEILAAERHSSEQGGFRAVLLLGEAGMGKSHLLQRFRDCSPETGWLIAAGHAAHAHAPFQPVRTLLRRWLDGSPGATARLQGALTQARLSPNTAMPLLRAFLSDSAPPAHLDTSVTQRRQFQALLCDWLLAAVADRPTILAVEDIQWLDPSSAELLEQLVGRVRQRSAPLLLICTTRPGGAPAWLERDALRLELAPLDDGAIGRLVRERTPELSEPDVAAIVARAEGVPLFAGELARLVAGDTGRLVDREIPETLGDLLMERLEGAGAALLIAQVVAVLGTTADPSSVAATAGIPLNHARQQIARLRAAGILVADSETGEERCRFTHALFGDAAYQMLITSRRRALHRAAATILSGTTGETRLREIATHWQEAGELDEAILAWRSAGRAAARRSAYAEAAHAFEAARGLAARQGLDSLCLEVLTELIGCLQICAGYSAPQTVAAVAEARRLSPDSARAAARFAQAASTWMTASSAGDYGVALEVAKRLPALAALSGRNDHRAASAMILMTARYRTGDFAGAVDALGAGRRWFTDAAFRARPGALPQLFGNASVVACISGRRRAARAYAARVEAAADGDDAYGRAFAASMAAMALLVLDEPARARGFAADALAVAEHHGFPQYVGNGLVMLGSATARLGAPAAGAAMLRDGLKVMDAAGLVAGRTLFLAWLSGAEADAGRTAAAMEAIDLALDPRSPETFWRAECLRLKAGLLRADGAREAALALLHEAETLAAVQGARLFQRRAVADLQRLKAAKISRRSAPSPRP
jgi:class 3 adenylate cyclase/tetratricopeptide (TPR) repeat protein